MYKLIPRILWYIISIRCDDKGGIVYNIFDNKISEDEMKCIYLFSVKHDQLCIKTNDDVPKTPKFRRMGAHLMVRKL